MSASAPQHVSIREFARREGCNEKLIRDAVKHGKLTKNSDGQIDAAKVGGGWRKRQVRTRIAADKKSSVNSAANSALTADSADISLAEAYPDFARVRSKLPNGCLATIERVASSQPLDHEALMEELDTLAWADAEADQQLADWHRWPSLICTDLAAELGVPDLAEPLEAALRRRVIDRLERDLGADAVIYLAPLFASSD